MVKKLFQLSLAATLVLAVAVGCNKATNPVVPAGSSVLHLSLPSKILGSLSKSVSSQDAVPVSGQGALEYYLSASGEAPVTGVVIFNDGSQVGNIFINLPKAGVWLVAAEWFSLSPVGTAGAKKARPKLVVPGYSLVTPEFVGADEVNVQGTTSFTLEMEDISNTESACYNGSISNADPVTCGYSYSDLFSFNSGILSLSSILGTTGDIQALYDLTTASTYLASFSGSTFAYLGNGDLVNYPVVPNNTAFYPDTLSAKTAVAGSASSPVSVGDIFVIKIPSQNAMVWFQVTSDLLNGCTSTNDSSIYFCFVYNSQGLNYMKFDQTAYGLVYCNQNNGPGPTPTPAP